MAAVLKEARGVLRFSTAGSVDDGKSTLIGRLLYEARAVFEDQLEAVARASRGEGPDLALLTDGLKAEREQGITIDVAYRYFATPRRKFIIADTPGHEQYTRNMATGASTADLALILVDAARGVGTQSRRHAWIAHLLGIPKLVVVVNKMDLVGFERAAFERVRAEFERFAARIGARDLVFVPVSALHGDNVTRPSPRMPWYEGPPLLELLETVEVGADAAAAPLRFPVQLAVRPDSRFRGYAGSVASGTVRVGQRVRVLPSGRETTVRAVHTFDGALAEAAAPQAVILLLADEIDVGRGDMIVDAAAPPEVSRELEADVVWFDEEPLDPERPYLVKHTTRTTRARITHVVHRVDVDALSHRHAASLALNDIGRIRLHAAQPLAVDPYAENRATGAFILIDPRSHRTVAAGMVVSAHPAASPNVFWREGRIPRAERERVHGHRAGLLWLTGLPCAGKSTIARALEARLFERGVHAYVLDGDNLRHGLSGDLGFSPEDRSEHLRRVAEVASILIDAGNLVIGAFVSPRVAHRERVRGIVGEEDFLEVHVSTPPEVCALRDRHGLYRRARAGEIPGFTGVDAPYEPPPAPDLVLPAHELAVEDAVERLMALLRARGWLGRAGGG
ncbi:sulfate adenylyltransferase subunit CysN [Inmirania thermothiophila]|uniref:Multifunctional fusion protein n=1 Tax=Inmirania thermothiophila TaxID=1750597 RepID=A0A3N1Y782_9GAMM|nr:sulfate adenylyltransferase subunit CysN [Inmirania thermothiophila]ROR34381.1 adenylylsulfate kinase /sulfate adenylyltransferase subunit 1 [Inmirania thermothiophila]